jgi:hypothetical protein
MRRAHLRSTAWNWPSLSFDFARAGAPVEPGRTRQRCPKDTTGHVCGGRGHGWCVQEIGECTCEPGFAGTLLSIFDALLIFICFSFFNFQIL